MTYRRSQTASAGCTREDTSVSTITPEQLSALLSSMGLVVGEPIEAAPAVAYGTTSGRQSAGQAVGFLLCEAVHPSVFVTVDGVEVETGEGPCMRGDLKTAKRAATHGIEEGHAPLYVNS